MRFKRFKIWLLKTMFQEMYEYIHYHAFGYIEEWDGEEWQFWEGKRVFAREIWDKFYKKE